MDIFDAHMHSSPVPDFKPAPGGYYLSCAAGPDDWPVLMKESRPEIRPFLGIHPMAIPQSPEEIPPLLEQFNRVVQSTPHCGIGECGLDRRYYKQLSRGIQEKVLTHQLRLAVQLNRPLCLHQVKATGALAELLEAEKPGIPMILHGFKEKTETAERYLKTGVYLSLGPGRQWNDSSFRSMVRRLPRSRILLESDWPYADPPYNKTMRTHYETAAAVFGIDREELLDIVKNNGKVFKN